MTMEVLYIHTSPYRCCFFSVSVSVFRPLYLSLFSILYHSISFFLAFLHIFVVGLHKSKQNDQYNFVLFSLHTLGCLTALGHNQPLPTPKSHIFKSTLMTFFPLQRCRKPFMTRQCIHPGLKVRYYIQITWTAPTWRDTFIYARVKVLLISCSMAFMLNLL